MDDIKFRGTLVPKGGGELGIKDGGLLRIVPAGPDYANVLHHKLRAYKGQELEITLSEESHWSDKMNDLFHALIRKVIASGKTNYWDKLGRAPETFEEVKTWVKVELGGAKVKDMGELTWIESWTNFSKKRALQTIENLLNWCIRVGIDIDIEKLESNSLKED